MNDASLAVAALRSLPTSAPFWPAALASAPFDARRSSPARRAARAAVVVSAIERSRATGASLFLLHAGAAAHTLISSAAIALLVERCMGHLSMVVCMKRTSTARAIRRMSDSHSERGCTLDRRDSAVVGVRELGPRIAVGKRHADPEQ